MVLDKILGKKNELEEQEYPEEFVPKGEAKSSDPDIIDFLAKKKLREEKKDGEKNASQESVPKQEEQSVGSVPRKVEESQEIEEEPIQPATEPKITYTQSFNIPVNANNIETAKKIVTDNVEKGYVIALQTGTYVDKSNFESVKKALDYFVHKNYKVIITTEQTQEVPDATK